jgi:hypothetical protein
LLQLGYPVEPVLEGLELLKKVSLSAKRVEEGHVQGSRLTQYHHRGGAPAMVARAQVGQARPLFSSCWSRRSLKAECYGFMMS